MLKNQIDRIKETNTIDFPVFQTLLTTEDEEVLEYLRQSARDVSDGVFHKKIYAYKDAGRIKSLRDKLS